MRITNFAILIGILGCLVSCGSKEDEESATLAATLESTTGCNTSTVIDQETEGKWRLDEIVCFDEEFAEVNALGKYDTLVFDIDINGSCYSQTVTDGSCTAKTGGALALEEGIIHASNIAVLCKNSSALTLNP